MFPKGNESGHTSSSVYFNLYIHIIPHDGHKDDTLVVLWHNPSYRRSEEVLITYSSAYQLVGRGTVNREVLDGAMISED